MIDKTILRTTDYLQPMRRDVSKRGERVSFVVNALIKDLMRPESCERGAIGRLLK